MIVSEQSPGTPKVSMRVPPMSSHPSGCMGFFFQHVPILFFPSGKGCLPDVRVRRSFHEHEQGGNPPQCLGCRKRTVPWKQSFGCPIDMGQTPLMRDGSKMRGNSLDNSTFPVTYRSGRTIGTQEICEYFPVAGKRFVALAWHKRPEKIFFGRNISMNEKDSQTTQPFSVGSIHPGSRSHQGLGRKQIPDIAGRDRVIKKPGKPVGNGTG